MDIIKLREYETLSPFEIKDFLAKAATKTATASAVAYLNAGRGNPNWIATSRAKRSSCWDSSRSPRASACSICHPASAACRRRPASPAGWRPG